MYGARLQQYATVCLTQMSAPSEAVPSTLSSRESSLRSQNSIDVFRGRGACDGWPCRQSQFRPCAARGMHPDGAVDLRRGSRIGFLAGGA